MSASTDSRLVVLPGDDITDRLKSDNKRDTFRLGPGLRQDSEKVFACKCGVLRKKEPTVYWVDNHQKRYVAVKGETVLGIVSQRAGDVFKVDIGASIQASLSYLGFEGATKKNRPDVKIGDIVYAKLLVANKDMEPELVCIDSGGKSSGLGVITGGGFMFRTSLNLCHKLLSPQCHLLKLLGDSIPFEIAIGMNGRIWIRAKGIDSTIAVINAVQSCEYMNNEQIRTMVMRLANALAGF